MKELISVIVPMYNAEKTIKRCIKSILIQEQVDYEIIIIDDGSTDHSLEICRVLEKKYKEVSVYHTKNKGVSHARNFGLKKAQGKWIVFVDADDELVGGVLVEAQKMQQKYECDLICWNMCFVVKGDTCLGKKFQIESVLIGKEEIDDMLNVLHGIPSSKNRFYGTCCCAPWGKMFLSEIIRKNAVKFPENISLGEDWIFLINYLHCCNFVSFLDKPFYRYHYTNNSLARKYRKNYFEILEAKSIEIEKIAFKYHEDSEKVLKQFWEHGLIDYIDNELRVRKSSLYLIVRVNDYLKKDIVRKYLIKNKKGKLSSVKIWLLTHRCTFVVAAFYVMNFKIAMLRKKEE